MVAINFKEEQLCVKLYDLEDKSVIAVYDTYKKAALSIGVLEQTVSRACNLKNKIYAPKLNKKIACRLTRKAIIT